MPRFNQKRWLPAHDTTPGLKTVAPGAIVLLQVASLRPTRPGESTGTRYDDYDQAHLKGTEFSVQRLGCPCGCGEFPRGSKAEFCMGHDARLRGKLIRAYMTGTKIVYVMRAAFDTGDGGEVILDSRVPEWTSGPIDPLEIARRFEVKGKNFTWEHYLEEAVERREGKNREVLARAVGSKRLITVGRWEYTGQVAAVYRLDNEDYYEIEYVTKAGGVKKARVPAAETMPALEG